jgi:hypothetical protein
MWLRRLWNWFKVREVLVAVPVGFEVPQDGNLGADPRFLREMAESMKKAPVVYEYMNDMLKKRRAYLETPPPTTTQTERDAMKWKKDQAAIEAALLTHLLYMSDYLSDSPVAVEALVGALESEAGKGTSDTPPAPVEATTAGQDAPKPGAEPSQTPGGTTEPKPPEAATAAPETPKQSPFPKELEQYKPLFDKKKWDPSKPDWHGEALKTLTEQEQFQGRLTTDLGLTRAQASDLEQALLGTPQSINEYRQRKNLPPLPFESTTVADKLKQVNDEWALWEQAKSQDANVSAQAIQAITQKLQDRRDNLRLEAMAESKAPKAAPSSFGSDAKVNWARILERDPEANKAMTALVPFLRSSAGNGLLGSFGMDVQNIMATPERAQQAYDLAQRLHRGDPQVFEAEVKKRVQAEMEENRKRQVAGGVPGGAAAAPITTTTDPAMEHLAGIR